MSIELFLADNLLLNLLILRLAAALLSVRPPLFRQLGAAIVSALTAALAAYLFPPLQSPFMRLPLLFLMAAALPVRGARGFAAAAGAVLFATFAVGGTVLALSLMLGGGSEDGYITGGIGLRAAILSAAAASFLPSWARRLLRRRSTSKYRVSVTLLHRGVLRRFEGIVDTGNTLAAPVSGLPVVVIRCAALAPYAKLPLNAATPAGRSRLMGFYPERLSVEGREVECVVAVAAGTLSAEAIVPPALCERNPFESEGARYA